MAKVTYNILYRDWRGGKGNKRPTAISAKMVMENDTSGPNLYVFDNHANCMFSAKFDVAFMTALQDDMKYTNRHRFVYMRHTGKNFIIDGSKNRLLCKTHDGGRNITIFINTRQNDQLR